MVAVVLSECFVTKIHGSWKTHLLVWSHESNIFVSTHSFFMEHRVLGIRVKLYSSEQSSVVYSSIASRVNYLRDSVL